MLPVFSTAHQRALFFVFFPSMDYPSGSLMHASPLSDLCLPNNRVNGRVFILTQCHKVLDNTLKKFSTSDTVTYLPSSNWCISHIYCIYFVAEKLSHWNLNGISIYICINCTVHPCYLVFPHNDCLPEMADSKNELLFLLQWRRVIEISINVNLRRAEICKCACLDILAFLDKVQQTGLLWQQLNI
jgi:hypothetical protein